MEIEVGEIVMCTVDRIVGTTVFVKIEGNGEGTIVLSEIAPGRIRNLREYVVPKKQIICKVLRTNKGQIELSLRRVTQKDQKEVREKYNLERSYKNILKTILGEQSREIIERGDIINFLEESKENPKKLEIVVGKENANKIIEIIKSQKQKKVIVKKEIKLTTTAPDGLEKIKKILTPAEGIEIKYLSAGKYSLKKESEDAKKADNKLKEIINEIQNKAKKEKFEFSLIEK